MNVKRHFVKRLALYVINPGDPDFEMLKRELTDNRGGDVYDSRGLRRYAEDHFGKKTESSCSAYYDYDNLISRASFHPECVFVLRWTRCGGLYDPYHGHYVYMRRREADYESVTIRRYPCKKREVS